MVQFKESKDTNTSFLLRHLPACPDRPVQHHLPPQPHRQQHHHHRPAAGRTKTAAEDHHQSVPAVPGSERPHDLPGVHPLHLNPQRHEGFHLWPRHVQAGHVLHGYVET